MKFLFFLSFLVGVTTLSLGQTTFTEDPNVIANPERGFYHHTETSSGSYNSLNEGTLRGYRENQGITQILRVFYLADFKEGLISKTYLDLMRRDFTTIRKAGIKVIVRFAYTKQSQAPYGDATPDVVFTHIDQLKPVLQENADVIATVQAGFVGAWGEWYYTDHFSNTVGSPNTQDWANRRTLVFKLLDALPNNRTVQLRTPNIKTTVLEDATALTSENAFSNTPIARLGHHNDCFVASSSDVGTYINPTVEKPYLESETAYLPMGGETCGLSSPYSDCPNAEAELERFHWSYLNIDYNGSVLNEWKTQGCFEEIELKLGYRYILKEATAATTAKPGSTLAINIQLYNDGYANPYNERLVEIVLKNKATNEEYYLLTDENPRFWSLNEDISIDLTAGIPSDATEGEYDLFLNLPDPMPSLYGSPTYSIRCANEGVWNQELGYNDLGIDIQLSNSATGTIITDQPLFKSRLASRTIDLENTGDLLSGKDDQSILVFWGSEPASQTRVIERSTDGINFHFLKTIPAHLAYSIDFETSANTEYSYRYYLLENGKFSDYSDTIKLSLNENYQGYEPISIDGNDDDWATVPPLSTTNADGFYGFRAFFDASNANFALYGNADSFSIYLNTDNDPASGQTVAGISDSGFDFLIKDDSLFEAIGNNWTYKELKAESAAEDHLKEIQIPFSSFTNMNTNLIIPIAAVITHSESSIYLTNPEGSAEILYRGLAPETPEGIEVRNSISFPKSRLQVRWNECSSCLGYIIERSIDNETFLEIADLPPNTLFLNDDNLLDETTYYYRISSYNELGKSSYSEIASGTTGEPEALGTEALKSILTIYPNPTNDYIHITGQNLEDFNFQIFDLSGRPIKSIKGTESKQRIDVSHLRSGIYFIRINGSGEELQYRFIKE